MPPKTRPKPPQRYVYVIGPAEGRQKIGLATDPRARLAKLQTGCPFALIIHAAVPVPFGQAHAVERRAHRALARCRVLNEWFATTPELAVAAARIAARAAEGTAQVMRSGDDGGLPLFDFAIKPAASVAAPQPKARGWHAAGLWRACRRLRLLDTEGDRGAGGLGGDTIHQQTGVSPHG